MTVNPCVAAAPTGAKNPCLAVGAALALALAGCAGHANTSSRAPQTAPIHPRPSPVVTRAAQAIARAEAQRVEMCGEDDAAGPRTTAAWPFPEGGAWLVHLVCFWGAYQPNARLVRIDAQGSASLLALPVIADDGTLGSTQDVADVAVEGGVLRELNKARGPGDCGRFIRARLVGDGDVELLEHRQQACLDDGDPIVDPAQWMLRRVRAAD
jgi:hypothetical protein